MTETLINVTQFYGQLYIFKYFWEMYQKLNMVKVKKQCCCGISYFVPNILQNCLTS